MTNWMEVKIGKVETIAYMATQLEEEVKNAENRAIAPSSARDMIYELELELAHLKRFV